MTIDPGRISGVSAALLLEFSRLLLTQDAVRSVRVDMTPLKNTDRHAQSELLVALSSRKSIAALQLQLAAAPRSCLQGFSSLTALASSLTHLDLLDCRFKEETPAIIETLSTFTELEFLGLASNKIGDNFGEPLCAAIERMTKIQVLDLSGNGFQVETVTMLARILPKLSALRTLNLSGNVIGPTGGQYLSNAIAQLPMLQVLKLNECDLQSKGMVALCAVLPSCATLEELNVTRNAFGDLGCDALSAVLPFTRIKRLLMKFNGRTSKSRVAMAIAFVKATHLEVSPGDETLEEIREYGRLLLTGEAQSNTLKVYLCGDPKAGKSTLVRTLRGIPHPKVVDEVEERTKGIEVSSFTTASGGKCVLWDFAGQVDYHVHHSLFMYPAASVFLVLIDASQRYELMLAQCEYWLRYICTQCPKGEQPNVLLLGSHADCVKDLEDENYSLLTLLVQDRFAGAVHFLQEDILFINCLEEGSRSVSSLNATMEKVREAVAVSGQSVTPLVCSLVQDALDNYRKENPLVPILTEKKMTLLCKIAIEQNSDKLRLGPRTEKDSLIRQVIRHLHLISSLYYDDTGPMKDIVVIDLSWLCHDVLGFLFCPPTMLKADKAKWLRFRMEASNGPVKISSVPLPELSSSVSVNALEVIEHFSLCCIFPHRGEKLVLFPSLLKFRPHDCWTASPSMVQHVGVKIMCSKLTTMVPPGFFSQIQVSVYDAIKGTFIWQNTVVCRLADVEASIQLINDHTIVLHVRGLRQTAVQCLKLLKQLLEIIESLRCKVAGLLFAVHYCSPSWLQSCDGSDPACFSLADVIASRHEGNFNVVNLAGVREAVAVVCGLTPGSDVAISSKAMLQIDEKGHDIEKALILIESDVFRRPTHHASSASLITPDLEALSVGGVTQCRYFSACAEYVKSLGIVEGFFDHSADRCYCKTCYVGEPVVLRGKPAKLCNVPFGWARFAIKVPEGPAQAFRIFEDYYLSYHGTRVELAPAIIQQGQLLYPGLTSASGFRITLPAGRIVDGNYALVPNGVGAFGTKYIIVARDPDRVKESPLELTLQELASWPPGAKPFLPNQNLFTSPSLNYASQYSSEKDDGRGGRIRLALQLRQKPDCFSVMQGTTSVSEAGKPPVDSLIPNDELEWFTPNLGPAIVITALLVNIDHRVQEQSTWL